MKEHKRAQHIHRLKWRNWPLAAKLTLTMTTMIIIAVIGVTMLSVRREQQTFRTELEQQADLLLDTLEAAMGDFLYLQDADALSDIMEALGENQEILISGRVYDTEGWIIADAYDEDPAYSIESDPFGEKLIRSETTLFEWQLDQLIAGRAVRVSRQLLGAVSVGLPTAPLQVKIASVRKQGIVAALATTVIGILVALLVTRSITRPLQKLVNATQHIAKGDLTQKIEIHSHDELAMLGNAMEHMRTRLYELYQNLRNANQTLQESLQTLRRTQEQLVQSEKMAALGGLVAGVAHEINTPVGVGVTAASHLEQKTRELNVLYHKGQMECSDLEKYLKTANESAGIILRNLRRAAEIIRSFKEVAVDQTSEQERTFNLRGYIDEILLNLHPKLKKTRHSVTVLCPEDLELDSYPGMFSQMITNFVMNSLVHGFDPNTQGEIEIEATREADILRIRYSDNGKGMREEIRSRVFEPFYTTKRGQGGTGLGLHLIYNLVTQRLNGHIRCESTPGKGTTFIIQLPLTTELPAIRG